MVKTRKKYLIQAKIYYSTPKGKYGRYKFGAKRRGFEFSLTVEQFSLIISQNCSYCGSKESIGIDRVDNNVGYSIENSVPCCTMCNMMKKNLPVEIFIEHCNKINNWNYK